MTVLSGARPVLGVALLGLALAGLPAKARAATPVATHVIAANVNDAGIDAARGSNYVWLAADPARRVGKLLVFLPSGGATNLPQDWTELGNEMGRLGYHTIVLAYKNEAPIAALPPAGCGNGPEATDAPPNCAIDARREMLDGRGESTVVAVDRANSIENRLNKALQHLAATYPGEGWPQFLDTSGEPKWADTVISGASLGAGEAVLVAAQHAVYRVALFHGWTDAKHGWVALGQTPSARYFALIHQRDNFFARTCYAYVALGLAQGCPLTGVAIDNRQPPFGSAQLVFNLEPFTLAGVTDPYHSSTTRDGWIAREADGTPSAKLLNAWRSVLGDSDADTRLDTADNCPAVANLDQADSDADGIGNACDLSVSHTGGVGGTVGATLSLTLGSPAAFGPLTPGVDRNYDATTTAGVVSSAGDAALAVSDTGSTATGRLVNGAFSLTEPLQAKAGSGTLAPLSTTAGAPLTLLTYAGPASNDPVAVAFRQHIGPTQALRTGVYSKTLTFTLSTTAP